MKKVFSVFVCLIFLLTTSHLTFAQYYCYGVLQDTNFLFGGQPDVCGMEANHSALTDYETAAFHQDCCQRVFQQIEVSGQSQITHFQVDFTQVLASAEAPMFIIEDIEFYSDYTRLYFNQLAHPPNIPIYKQLNVYRI